MEIEEYVTKEEISRSGRFQKCEVKNSAVKKKIHPQMLESLKQETLYRLTFLSTSPFNI